jgi:hypothetical protein
LVDRQEGSGAEGEIVRGTAKQVGGKSGVRMVGVASVCLSSDTVGDVTSEPRAEEHTLRSKFMLIFRGGAVSRHDLSPSELQAHVEKWYVWSDELARQGRRNAGTPLDNPGATVQGHERVVTDGPYAESKDLVTGSLVIEAASLEDAIDVARTCPTYEFDGSVEVRPVQD